MQPHRFPCASLALFIGLLASLAGPARSAPPALSAVNAVVRLPSHGASATVIHTQKERTLLLGCGHAFIGVDRARPIEIDGPDAPRGPASLLACDYQLDLSLIEVRAGPVRFVAPVAGASFRPSGRLLSVGYDEMKTPATRQPASIVGSADRLTFTRERPWHGRSGGALLDADAGLLIGVVQGYETAPPWRGLYTSHAAIIRFLRQNGWKTVSSRQNTVGSPPPPAFCLLLTAYCLLPPSDP